MIPIFVGAILGIGGSVRLNLTTNTSTGTSSGGFRLLTDGRLEKQASNVWGTFIADEWTSPTVAGLTVHYKWVAGGNGAPSSTPAASDTWTELTGTATWSSGTGPSLRVDDFTLSLSWDGGVTTHASALQTIDLAGTA